MKDEINFHKLFHLMRQIHNVTLDEVAEGLYSQSTIQKIENGNLLPEKLMRNRLMERMGVSEEIYEDYLQPEEYNRCELRKKILRSIEKKELAKLEQYLKQYEAYKKIGKIELQFITTMWLWFYKQTNAPFSLQQQTVKKAVFLTMPKIIKGFPKKLLLSNQELNLLIEYVHLHERLFQEKENEYFIQYEMILNYIEQSRMDIIGKAKIYPKAVYYFCKFILQKDNVIENIYKALRICNQAITLLRDTEKLYYFVELLELKDVLIKKLQNSFSENEHLQNRDTWTAMLDEIKEWKELFFQLYQEYEVCPYMEHDCHIYWVTKLL